MALVGTANILLRVSSSNVEGDLRRSLSGVSKIGSDSGKTLGQKFSQGFQGGIDKNLLSRLGSGLDSISGELRSARQNFETLYRTSFFVNSGLSAIVGGISSVIGGLGALIGSAGAAAASITVLGNAYFALASGLGVAKLALGGVGKALSALNKTTGGGGGGASSAASEAAAKKAQAAADAAVQDAEKSLARTIQDNREQLVNANNDVRDAQLALNKAFEEGRDQIKQLGFDAEDAALNEKKAELALEDARTALAKVQDLPPNSRARQEALLAYQEADLNLREAKAKSEDLNKQQDQLAKTGVAGTDAVIAATNALAQAEANKAKTVRDAAQSEADAKDNLAKANQNAADAAQKVDNPSGGGGGGADPFAGLNQAQIDFVKFIQSLKPQFDELKKIAAESFLPPLQQAITLLSTQAFDTVARGVGVLGAAMGQAAISIATAVVQARNLAALNTVFDSSGRLIQTFGQAIGNLYGIIIQLLAAASPVAERFFTFVNGQLSLFNDYLAKVTADGTLAAFFQRSGDIAAKFGTILGNIFGGFGAIIRANFGPGSGGDIILDWLITVTDGFKNLDDTTGKATGLRTYFQDVARNATSVLGAIGELIKQIGSLGAMKEVGETFDKLKEGAPLIGDIARAGLAAGPALAQLVVNILGIFKAFADGPQAIAFFNTLNVVAKALNDFFNGPLVQGILAVIAPIQGVAEAIGLMLVGVGVALKIAGGFAVFFKDGITLVTTALKILAANPILIVLGLLAAAFVYLYKTNQDFANQINGIVATVLPALQAAFAPLLPVITQLGTTLATTFGQLAQSLAPVLVTIVGLVVNLISAIAPLIGQLLTGLVPVIGTLVQALGGALVAVMPAVNTLLQALSGVIITVLNALSPLIPIVVNLVTILVGALSPILPVLAKAFSAILTAVSPLITMLGNTLGTVITQLLNVIGPLITQLVTDLAPAFTEIVDAVLPVVSQLITALMPAITSIVSAIAPLVQILLTALTPILTTLTPIFKLLGDVVGALAPIFTLIGNVVSIVVSIIAAIIQTLVDLITGNFSDIGKVWLGTFQQIHDFTQNIIDAIVKIFQNGFKIAQDVFNTVFTFIVSVVQTQINIVRNVIDSFVGFFRSAFQNIGDFFSSVWNNMLGVVKGIVNGIIGTVQGMINAVIDGINGATRGLKDAVSAVAGALGIKISIGNLPHVSLPRLAKGGVVSPSTGGSIVNVAEAGKPERIEPLDDDGLSKRDRALIDSLKGAGAGIQIDIHAAPGMDIQALAAEVGREISFQMRRGGL